MVAVFLLPALLFWSLNRIVIADYAAGMKYVLERGIFGKGVNIKIFKDADVPMAKVMIPRRLMQFFQSVDIYENKLAKDTGVLPDELDIQRVTFKGGYCK